MSVRHLAIAGLVAFSAPAFAATPINQTRPLPIDGSVHIENVKGKVIVRTWAQPQVKITGSLGKGAEKLLIEGSANSLDISVKYPNGGWKLWGNDGGSSEPTVLEITLPNRASVDVNTVSADIDVQQMAGRKLEVQSVSGSITITASSPGQASVESVSGDAIVRITTSRLDASSVSGKLRASGGITGDVKMETVSGDMELGALGLDRLELSTVSGDATLHAALRPNGKFKAETLSGDLSLRMPANSSARLYVETFSGDIRSPSGTVHKQDHGPGKTLDARLGAGQGDIHLESFSGDVDLQLE